MSVLGFDLIPVGVIAEATSKTSGLQLVMVLDATGSMRQSAGSTRKMTALKNASNMLVDSLFGDDSTSDALEIAIVPYVTTVNVGHLLDSTYVDTTGLLPAILMMRQIWKSGTDVLKRGRPMQL